MYKDKLTELDIYLWENDKKIKTLENKEMDVENYCRNKKLEIVGLREQT